jgi:predicted PurR-regulated permease PerM
VRWLENRGIKRGVSAAGVALLVLGGLAAAGTFVGPPIARQASSLVTNGPRLAERLQNQAEGLTRRYPALGGVLQSDALAAENLMRRGQGLLPRIGRYTVTFLGGLAAGFFVLVIALYTLAAPKPLIRGFLAAVPPNYRAEAAHALTRVIGQLESYALATLLLMLVVGVASGLGLWLIGVPNPLLFGLLAGLGEAIPTIGPILSAVPPALVALADEPNKALWVAGLFLLVQQLENNVLVPIIMGRSLNLHPVSILFFVLALGSFVGLIGALLAVPAAIIVKVCFEEFYAKKRAPKMEALDEAAEQILRAGARPGRTTTPQTATSQVTHNDN